MKKTLITFICLLILLSGCGLSSPAHTRRYIYKYEGETHEDVTISLDKTDTYITHISMSFLMCRDLLELLADSTDDNDLYNEFLKVSDTTFDLSFTYERRDPFSDESVIKDNFPLKVDNGGQYPHLIAMNTKIGNIDLSSKFEVRHQERLLEKLSLLQYRDETGMIRFDPESIAKDRTCLLYPAVSASYRAQK